MPYFQQAKEPGRGYQKVGKNTNFDRSLSHVNLIAHEQHMVSPVSLDNHCVINRPETFLRKSQMARLITSISFFEQYSHVSFNFIPCLKVEKWV